MAKSDKACHQPSGRMGGTKLRTGNMRDPLESFRPEGSRYSRLSMGQTAGQTAKFQSPHHGSQR